MLIIYETKTGKVIENKGTISAYPLGIPGPEDYLDPEVPKKYDDEEDEQFEARLALHADDVENAKKNRIRSEDSLFANAENLGYDRKDLSVFRLHDIDDAELVDKAFKHEVSIDPKTKTLAIGAVRVPPNMPTDVSAREDAIDAAEAKAASGDTAGAMADLFAILRNR